MKNLEKGKKEIHIGKLINERRMELGMSHRTFAKLINKSYGNIFNIYERSSIDTELLAKISKALNYNFFEVFTDKAEEKSEIIEELFIPIRISREQLLKGNICARCPYNAKEGA